MIANAIPIRLYPSPCHPPTQIKTTIPASRNGKTSQFGIRRLRISVNVATARTKTVGHQAMRTWVDQVAGQVQCKIIPPRFPIQIGALLTTFSPSFSVEKERLNSMRYGKGMEASVHVSPLSGYGCPAKGIHESNARERHKVGWHNDSRTRSRFPVEIAPIERVQVFTV